MSVNVFNTDFLSPLLQLVGRENKSIVLLGDFNINLLKYLLPQVILPTRITESSQTLIDNIFTTTFARNCISGNILHSISDHLPQFFCVSSESLTHGGSESLPKTYANWSKFHNEEFNRDFCSLEWREILSLEGGNIDISFDAFLSKVNSFVDRHVPTATLTKKQHNKKPWITSGILKSMQKRDFYLRKYLNCKSDEFRVLYYPSMRYRNQIVALCRQS